MSFIDQDGTLIGDIFIKYKILNILFCVEINIFFLLITESFQ